MNLVSNYLEKNILSIQQKSMAFNQECRWNYGSKSLHSFWATLYNNRIKSASKHISCKLSIKKGGSRLRAVYRLTYRLWYESSELMSPGLRGIVTLASREWPLQSRRTCVYGVWYHWFIIPKRISKIKQPNIKSGKDCYTTHVAKWKINSGNVDCFRLISFCKLVYHPSWSKGVI